MTSDSLLIRPAEMDEAAQLSDLAMRSKAHWDYSQEFMDACRDELRVSPSKITSDSYFCFVAEQAQSILGYYILKLISARQYELEALFLEPSAIGQGIGRALLEHAKTLTWQEGAQAIVINSDPNAEAFYLSAGAKKVGSSPSGSIPGRVIPLLEIAL
ncbi:GNAT family N-acetyltransferase [uncultured Pseudoteredinibacter sp.]|uniref:GNAT family N-acetyltransferase n=1 Tax=uncultured Pseudoteredinibacter sp. TaxID=1641701 RepID=UPI002620EB33|nr:GNAT family N-acetyltransferase [uncultured Pseudoteredinibacter sp.]